MAAHYRYEEEDHENDTDGAARDEQSAYRGLGRDTVGDEVKAGRDERRQTCRRGDGADGELRRIFVSHHLGMRDAGHHAAGGGSRAAYRAENGADDGGRLCKSGLLMAGQDLEAVEQVVADACFRCQLSHEDEHRGNGGGVAREASEYRAAEHIERALRRFEKEHTAADARDRHRNSDRDAEKNEHYERYQPENTDHYSRHIYCFLSIVMCVSVLVSSDTVRVVR